MTHEEITENLLKVVPGAFDAYHVTEFQCYRKAKDGNTQTVTVKILDAGPNTEHGIRYQCHATSSDGKSASGNGGVSLNTVLATVHWGDLDR